ncbi:hypothetical protein CMI37_14900 [Candidatus Pacearchaeota archaeon]|nr:hypothetical protein [Candidatus Pacearchaeota archaeon]
MTLDGILDRTAPAGWPGSLPEFLVFRELLRLGKRPDIDFTYQSAFQGGRLQKGGMVVDFLFVDPPDLAINVQGDYYHAGPAPLRNDRMARAQLAGQGVTLIFIDETDILRDARRFVRAALRYQDLSRLGR